MTDSLPDRCPGCGAANGCALAAGKPAAACWCLGAPPRLPLPAGAGACYCDDCLQGLAAARRADHGA